MSNSKRPNKIAIMSIVLAIGVLIVTVAIISFSSSETYISKKSEHSTISILDCTIASPDESFFNHDLEIHSEHRVKAEYLNDFFNGFNFTYTGTYQSVEDASNALSWLHADYNKYIAKTGVYQEDLYPTFSAMESKVIINLFLPTKFLNSGTADFVFIKNDEFVNLGDMSIHDMRKLYENKGFTCNITNN